MEIKLVLIFLGAVLTNNFVLSYFLGICPFLGVSGKWESAMGMGLATTFVMTITSVVTWVIYHKILHPLGLEYLEYVSFIMVISSLVQFVEMVIHKMFEPLYRSLGIYLPLITTNCAILGLALFMVLREYNFFEAVTFGFGAGAGFTLAIIIMAGIREELDFADVPEPFKGGPITLIIAGILALAFMGFGGMIAQ
ncbi:MAG: electron transport complex subunit RsxA [Calditrichaeota bacterium]|nr:MAG: electron transport complex subunit RsxA [Calditrichota bacterium]MBL1207228.1 electron transport complex subunit RsxA [Calditrichota bacterium]NOG47061.1 electron transport complex subunit RsxA [Calditrichota bacterium]